MTVEKNDEWGGVSEERILRELTQDGVFPIERFFLMEGMVCSWNPTEGGVLLHRIEDNQLFGACREYVRSRGSTYRSLGAVLEVAEQEKWEGWSLARIKYADLLKVTTESEANNPGNHSR